MTRDSFESGNSPYSQILYLYFAMSCATCILAMALTVLTLANPTMRAIMLFLPSVTTLLAVTVSFGLSMVYESDFWCTSRSPYPGLLSLYRKSPNLAKSAFYVSLMGTILFCISGFIPLSIASALSGHFDLCRKFTVTNVQLERASNEACYARNQLMAVKTYLGGKIELDQNFRSYQSLLILVFAGIYSCVWTWVTYRLWNFIDANSKKFGQIYNVWQLAKFRCDIQLYRINLLILLNMTS